MDSYIAVYKCQICGTLVQYGEPNPVPYDELPALCGKVVQNQRFAENPYLYTAPMQIPHKCKNGGCGMAYFAGFTPKSSNPLHVHWTEEDISMENDLIHRSAAVEIIKAAKAELVHDYAYAAADLLDPFIKQMEEQPMVCRKWMP